MNLKISLSTSIEFVTAFLLFSIQSFSQSGNFIGVNGLDGGGIYRMDEESLLITQTKDLTHSSNPKSELLEYDGRLWGVTEGVRNGHIFYWSETLGEFKEVYELNHVNGRQPNGDLIAYNGWLWGVAGNRYTLGEGIIYRFDPTNLEFENVHIITSGASPFGQMLEVDGNLWGMSSTGGEHDAGYLFKLDPTSFELEVILSFEAENTVAWEETGLVEFDNLVYGCLRTGGQHSKGAIFSIKPDGSDFILLHEFDGSNGSHPSSKLFLHDGKFWGTTYKGGANDSGVFFHMQKDGSEFSVIKTFDEQTGKNPLGDLQLVGDKIVGVLEERTLMVYSIDVRTHDFEIIHDNKDKEIGDMPVGGLTSFEGNFYGLTYFGGSAREGAIYQVSGDLSEIEEVYSFRHIEGNLPRSKLILHNGYLYGTTEKGGEFGYGTIFRTDSKGEIYEALYHFDNSIGANPLHLTSDGCKIWGMTELVYADEGSIIDPGWIFEFDPNLNEVIPQYQLDYVPRKELLLLDSVLIGFTDSTPLHGGSGIFSYHIEKQEFEYLYIFDRDPKTFDSPQLSPGVVYHDEYLYGCTTKDGAVGEGSIYRFNMNTRNLEILAELTTETGYRPAEKMVIVETKLYAAMKKGGAYTRGTILRLDLDELNLDKIHDFDDAINLDNPNGGLTYHEGKIWGVTAYSSNKDNGLIYYYDLDKNTFFIAAELAKGSGGYPLGELIHVESKQAPNLSLGEFNDQITYGNGPLDLGITSDSSSEIILTSSDTLVLSIDETIQEAQILGVGGVTIYALQEGNEDYFDGCDFTILQIDKALLTAMVNDTTKEVGQPNPEFTFTYEGFQYDDDTSRLLSLPTVSTEANEGSPIGVYALEASGAESNVYEIEYINGWLHINEVLSVEANSNQLLIFPNPVSSSLKITTPTDHFKSLNIYDLKGELVASYEIKEEEFLLQQIPNGIYIGVLDTGDRKFKAKILIKK